VASISPILDNLVSSAIGESKFKEVTTGIVSFIIHIFKNLF